MKKTWKIISVVNEALGFVTFKLEKQLLQIPGTTAKIFIENNVVVGGARIFQFPITTMMVKKPQNKINKIKLKLISSWKDLEKIKYNKIHLGNKKESGKKSNTIM